jgi:RNA polymerase sigma-70 factor (ECF subfamily)
MSEERADDPEGWVDRHGDCLYSYALLRLRAPDLAADVVQETFLEALRAWDSFAGRSSERTWLVGILKHKIADHFRRANRQPLSSNGVSHGASVEPEFDRRGRWRVTPASWAGEPSRDIETREFWEAFRRCLSKLPKGLAEAFLLRELEGFSPGEVQQHLGISPANLWVRLHRSRSLLRQCLESGWFGVRAPSPTLQAREAKGPPPP